MAIDKNAITKEAQKYAAKGQFDKAIAEWKKIVRETPNDPNLYNTIGDLCLKRDAKGEAVVAYKKAADLLAEDGFTSKAIALYKKVLNIDPVQIDVHILLGDMNVEKGLVSNALENYKYAAVYYAQHEDTSKSLAMYQKLADLSPANTAFRLKLADMYAKEGMMKEASQAYLEAADVHVSKEAFQEARQIFEKVLALDPGNKAVYSKAGIVYYKEGKFNEACKALKPALEADPANQELLDLYLKSLSKAGRNADAEEVFKKLLAQDPGLIDLRDKLYHIYLTKQDYDKALDEAWAIAAARLESKELDAAEEMLKGFVASCPRNAAGHRKLASLYKKIDKPKEAANELVRAAEILIEDGVREDAEKLLVRAVELAPDLPEARTLLDSLQQTPEPEPELIAVEPLPQVEDEPAAVEAQLPATAPVEDPALITALTEVEVLVKYGLAEKALEQLVGLVARYSESPMALSRLSSLYHDQGNEQKAVELALALAELYEHREMPEQAEVALRSALEWYPDSGKVQGRLCMEPVVPAGPEVITPLVLGQEADLSEPAPQYSQPEPAMESAPVFDHDHLSFGGIDGQNEPVVEAVSPDEVIALGPSELTSLMEEVVPGEALPLESVPEILEPFVVEPEAEDAPFILPPIAEQTATELETEDAPFILPPDDEQLVFQPEIEDALKATTPVVEPLVDLPEVFEPLEEKPAYEGERLEPGAEEGSTGTLEQDLDMGLEQLTELNVGEVWAEAEFYYQQGLFNEAKKHYARILQLDPGDKRAIARLSEISREAEETQEFTKLTEAVDELEGSIATETHDGKLATSESDEEAVRQLRQEIQALKKPASEPEFEDFFDLGEELNKVSAPAAAPYTKAEQPEEEFFDLAAELRDELSGISLAKLPSASAEDQTLDDIFEDFKKGVEAQEGRQNVDTHYNLGVSYKEMGLLDDAIAEFSLTPEGESKYVQSRYLLGLCYMEQGEYRGAIEEIHNAMNYSMSYGGNADEKMNMYYDLGLAYQGAGNAKEAFAAFQHVHDADPAYRDITAKLREFQPGQHVSMDQLKNDIEKEISAKFLVEGEKIERQEKTRKNEKVRQ